MSDTNGSSERTRDICNALAVLRARCERLLDEDVAPERHRLDRHGGMRGRRSQNVNDVRAGLAQRPQRRKRRNRHLLRQELGP